MSSVELPRMSTANMQSANYTAEALMATAGGYVETSSSALRAQEFDLYKGALKYRGGTPTTVIEPPRKEYKMATNKPPRRLVKVVIVDPDEKVPLENALVHSGGEQFTDLTDQELFFELDIKNMLDAHNAKRKAIRDKEIKDKEVFLDPIKVRNLSMTVVEIAKF